MSIDGSVLKKNDMNMSNQDFNIMSGTNGTSGSLSSLCPDNYKCPITQSIMIKPVILLCDQITYEESALIEWLTNNNISPYHGKKLDNKKYVRNLALQNAIDEWKRNSINHNINKKHINNIDFGGELQSSTIILDSNDNDIIKLKEILNNNSMGKYQTKFIKNGFRNINDLYSITLTDLISMDIPRLHAKRLLNYLQTNSPIKSEYKSPIVIQSGRISKPKNSCNINILLLGDSDVGKTSLRKRLELGRFVATNTTLGVELSCLTTKFKDTDIQITIWDPAGQERFRSITKQFFRKAHGAVIVFSSNEPDTFKSVQYWMNEIENNCDDDIECVLLCNKIDLVFNPNNNNNNDISLTGINNSQLDDVSLNDEDSNESKSNTDSIHENIKYAIEIAQNKKIPFYTTSAKTGECVNKPFEDLVWNIFHNENIWNSITKQKTSDKTSNNKSNNKNINNDNSNDSNNSMSRSRILLTKIKNKLSKKNVNKNDDIIDGTETKGSFDDESVVNLSDDDIPYMKQNARNTGCQRVKCVQ